MSATKVRGLKAPGFHEDGGGLRLIVADSGAKRWVMRISARGKRHQLGFGSYPSVSLERAREKAAEARRTVSEGRDLLAERRVVKRGEPTFQEVFGAYFASKGATLTNPKHRAQWQSTMEAYAFPVIGDRPVGDIRTDEILQILRPIWPVKPETAGRVLQRIDAVMHFAIANEDRERASPCIGAKRVLGPRRNGEVRHHRFLPHAEVAEFVGSLHAGKVTTTRLALEWLILTATRSRETRLACWEEIDEMAATWTIPAGRMKARRTHVVPLSGCCLEILQEARTRNPAGGLLFPGLGGRPLSDMTMTKLVRDMGLAHRATVHGFRSTFKVWCAEVIKARDEVSEAALAHAIPQKVRAAYLRTDFLDERRELMAAWARYIEAA